MEIRSVRVQDADANATFGYTLQAALDLGTSITIKVVGFFPSLSESAAVGQFIDDNSTGITYNSTNHDPFSI